MLVGVASGTTEDMPNNAQQLRSLFTNGAGSTLRRGEVIRASGNNAVVRSFADSQPHVQGTIGTVRLDVPNGYPFFPVTWGDGPVLLETGLLPPQAGGQLFVSAAVAGRATTVAPAAPLAQIVGTIKDASRYSIDSTVIADIGPGAGNPATGGGGSDKFTMTLTAYGQLWQATTFDAGTFGRFNIPNGVGAERVVAAWAVDFDLFNTPNVNFKVTFGAFGAFSTTIRVGSSQQDSPTGTAYAPATAVFAGAPLTQFASIPSAAGFGFFAKPVGRRWVQVTCAPNDGGEVAIGGGITMVIQDQ